MRLKDLKHVVSTKQFMDKAILEELFSIASDMEKRDKENDLNYASLRSKLLANVFYEPSTRTRFSFDAAMQKLGGRIIDTESAGHFSSVTKGETLSDTIKTISAYADAIVLRHPVKGSAKTASEASDVPVINAGDGIGEHPTQALLDIFTIKKELGRLQDFSIAMAGDLKHGRTIHSLLHLISLYPGVKVLLVSPDELRLPEEYKEFLRSRRVPFDEHPTFEPVWGKLDILYMTRVQRERFADIEEYERVKDSYVVDRPALERLKKSAVIMHPLPRLNEISVETDADPRAAYFRQAKNGLYIRMALLFALLRRN
jgi:aspartate carbamoyltransferase catalytic subunit